MQSRFKPAVSAHGPPRKARVDFETLLERREVLVQLAALGICQTDRRALLGTKTHSLGRAEWPVLGHEGGGYVMDPGPRQGELEPGTKVVLLPHLTCGRCGRCLEGRTNLCPDLRHLGLHLPGTMAERGLFPAACVFPVGEDFPDEALPLVEPLACVSRAYAQVGDVFHALLRHDPRPELTVFGLGSMGALIALHGKRLYPPLKVTAVEPNPLRRRLALQLGIADEVRAAPPDGRHSPLTVVAASAAQASSDAVLGTRSGGTVLLFSGINLDDLADEDPERRARAARWERVHRAEEVTTFAAPAGPVRLVGSSGYTHRSVRRSVDELRRHYHHYAPVQNVVIRGLSSREAHYRSPGPRTVIFPMSAVEALLSARGIDDPQYGEEIAWCLKPLIRPSEGQPCAR